MDATATDAFAEALPALLDMREPRRLSAPGAIARVYRVMRPAPFDPDQREAAILKVYGLGDNEALHAKLFEKERARIAELVTILNDPRGASCERLARFERVHQVAWEGRALFAIEGVYYPAGDLARWRRGRDRISLGLLERLLDDIIEGLSFLHEQCRWVHHDLKPSNVFLEDGPEGPRALVGDFGAALPQDRTVTINQQLTFLYAPSNPAEEFGRRAYDVFSLACLTSFLIRGRFAADDRRYGRLDAGAIASAAAEEAVAGADAAWYRDLGRLLRRATGPAKARCGLEDFRRALRRAGARCRRRARLRAWLERRKDAVMVGGAGLLFALSLAFIQSRGAMPAEAREVAGYRLAASPGRLRIALPADREEVAQQLPIPSPLLGAGPCPEGEAWPGVFLAWGADWLLRYDPEAAELYVLDEDGALRDRGGRLVLDPWGSGQAGSSGLAPWSDGLLRWRGRRIEAWARSRDRRFVRVGARDLDRDLAAVEPALGGGAVQVRDRSGASSALALPFLEDQAEENQ